jgi:hypothetical protein
LYTPETVPIKIVVSCVVKQVIPPPSGPSAFCHCAYIKFEEINPSNITIAESLNIFNIISPLKNE